MLAKAIEAKIAPINSVSGIEKTCCFMNFYPNLLWGIAAKSATL
jgi:hypothetical protein